MNQQPNEICCPKCGSNQITANKKGFSGKKAVAGAVLTGGIGLLAGTIGSNKIMITCLNCGNQFKPGDKPRQTIGAPKIIWDEATKTHIQNPQYNESTKTNAVISAIVVLALVVFIAWLLSGNGKDNVSTSSPTQTTVSTPASINIEPKVKYQIIQQDEDAQGFINLVYVYIKNIDSIGKLNTYLVEKLKNANVTGFQIYYFNNKKVAKGYFDLLKNPNVSDDEIERISTHIIGHYDYNVSDGGSLKLGKEAQEP